MKTLLLIAATAVMILGAMKLIDALMSKREKQVISPIEMTSIYKLKRIYVQPAHWWAK